jgi:hypothetical protein
VSDRGFVEMARNDVCTTMTRWHTILEGKGPRTDTTEVYEMIGRLVNDNIMLLRAVEEVEARPWWRRRRYNPYAH